MKISPGIIHTLHSGLNKSGVFDGDPEYWHKLVMSKIDSAEQVRFILDSLRETLYFEDKSLEVEVGNMTFKNPVGLAAGFAKQSHGLKLLEALGFGYLTIGGITANPQDGVENEVKRLAKRKELGLMPNIPIIANLCNSLLTPTDKKTDEFLFLMEKLYRYVDGFEINVSCPNQCGVTSMQQEQVLKDLLKKVEKWNKILAFRNGCERKTILVKIAPLTKNEDNPEKIKDLTLGGLEIIANVCNDVGIDGVTATNTSQEHNYDTKIIKPDGGIIKGGLSGLGLHQQSLRTVRELRQRLDKTIPIIGVGGIGYDVPKDGYGCSGVDMLKAGASSVEILSSLVQNSIVVPHYLKESIATYKQHIDARNNANNFLLQAVRDED